jgi:tetratricopeptide (TPR) repeat protein
LASFKGRAIPALVIAVAAAWVYWPALRGSWIWDDGLEVAANPVIQGSGGWWRAWVAPYGMDYLPLKSTLQWAQWHLWSAHVIGYHASNLALHICGALLLWRLLERMGAGLPWIAGLLFAIHPMAVESVAWISEFKNTLSFPAILLAMLAYMDWDAIPRTRSYLLSLLWFTVAMLCKTSVVLFPAFLLIFAWWRRGRIGMRDLRAAAPFFAVSIVLGLVALKFQWERAMGLADVPVGWRPDWGQAGWSILAYLRSCVLPVDLAPVYEPFQVSLPGALPWLIIGAVLAFFWTRRAGWGRHALIGSGWFLINLVPVVGLVPIAYLRVSPRADHLAYLSLAAVVGGAAAAFGALWRRVGDVKAARAAAACAAFAACIVLATGTRAYAALFRNEGVFWSAAAKREPGAWLARSNWGRVLLREGHPEAAKAELLEAARLEPDSAEVRVNLGDALGRLGHPDEAVAEYRMAVKLAPNFAGGHYDLGRALLLSGNTDDAADELRTALRIDPGYAAAHNNLGLALARLGRLNDAIVEYRAALRSNPNMPEVHLNIGNACLRLDRAEDAVAEYRAALRLDPNYPAAHRNLATALETLGQMDEARHELEAASGSR